MPYNSAHYWPYGGWYIASGCCGGYKDTPYLLCTGYFDFNKLISI
ncbi:MAG: hypothetical protein R3B92_00045 [Patescibacteria group bacterium]